MRTGVRSDSRFSGATANRYTIVGVVGTINSIDLGEPVTKERIYYPAAQLGPRMMALVLKTGLDPQTLVSAVRAAVRSIDPEQPISDVRTMDQWMARSLQTRRTPMALLALFGAVALVLSAIGIYGVLAFGVAQRVREFGIRQALGADRGVDPVAGSGSGAADGWIGVVFGLAGSFVLTRYLQSLLFGVGAHDVSVFLGVTVLLLIGRGRCLLYARPEGDQGRSDGRAAAKRSLRDGVRTKT